jgi:hypothetical protein
MGYIRAFTTAKSHHENASRIIKKPGVRGVALESGLGGNEWRSALGSFIRTTRGAFAFTSFTIEHQ